MVQFINSTIFQKARESFKIDYFLRPRELSLLYNYEFLSLCSSIHTNLLYRTEILSESKISNHYLFHHLFRGMLSILIETITVLIETDVPTDFLWAVEHENLHCDMQSKGKKCSKSFLQSLYHSYFLFTMLDICFQFHKSFFLVLLT